MIYPGKTHGITGASENIHLYAMILEFFRRNLECPGHSIGCGSSEASSSM